MVTLAMHQVEGVKIWWRSRYMDIQEDRCTINIWETKTGALIPILPRKCQNLGQEKTKETQAHEKRPRASQTILCGYVGHPRYVQER